MKEFDKNYPINPPKILQKKIRKPQNFKAFYASLLIKRLKRVKKKKIFTFFYYKGQIKSKGLFFQKIKQKKPYLITKFSPALEANLAKHQCLTYILNFLNIFLCTCLLPHFLTSALFKRYCHFKYFLLTRAWLTKISKY